MITKPALKLEYAIAFRLGRKKPRFFSSPEGDQWLRYYTDVMIRYKAANR